MTDVLIYWYFFWQTMGVHEFTETVSCFMRVTWAAAAGRLHLLGSSQPIIESSTGLYGCGRRSRQSSTGKKILSDLLWIIVGMFHAMFKRDIIYKSGINGGRGICHEIPVGTMLWQKFCLITKQHLYHLKFISSATSVV